MNIFLSAVTPQKWRCHRCYTLVKYVAGLSTLLSLSLLHLFNLYRHTSRCGKHLFCRRSRPHGDIRVRSKLIAEASSPQPPEPHRFVRLLKGVTDSPPLLGKVSFHVDFCRTRYLACFDIRLPCCMSPLARLERYIIALLRLDFCSSTSLCRHQLNDLAIYS